MTASASARCADALSKGGGALARDRSAARFDEGVLPYLADALALARWLTGNRDDAEDIVQESCARALKALGAGDVERPRPWFLAIVRNTAFSWMAKNRPKWLVSVGDAGEADAAGGASEALPHLTPEAELIGKADAAAVRAAVADLPLALREVVVLRDFNELTYREIAEMLRIPIGTVMSRLSRGRMVLATTIAESVRDT